MTDDLVLPNVLCDHHPEQPPAPGYAVCVHVLDGRPVAYYTPASPRHLGQLLCARCSNGEADVDALRLICRRCVDAITRRTDRDRPRR